MLGARIIAVSHERLPLRAARGPARRAGRDRHAVGDPRRRGGDRPAARARSGRLWTRWERRLHSGTELRWYVDPSGFGAGSIGSLGLGDLRGRATGLGRRGARASRASTWWRWSRCTTGPGPRCGGSSAATASIYWAKQNCAHQTFEAHLLQVLDDLSRDRVIPVVGTDPDRGLHLVPDQGRVLAADDRSRRRGRVVSRRAARHVAPARPHRARGPPRRRRHHDDVYCGRRGLRGRSHGAAERPCRSVTRGGCSDDDASAHKCAAFRR